MKNMRQRPRVEISHIITYTFNVPEDFTSGTSQGLLVNLSTSGALIETKEPVKGKSLIIGNNSDTMPRMVIGDVVYNDTVISAEEGSYGMYRTGIKFTDTHDNAKEFVVSIVKANEAEKQSDNSVIPSTSNQLPHFDSDSIHSILDDEATTASHIDIDDLLLDEEHDPEFDVLENIATVLEENEVRKCKPDSETVLKIEAVQDLPEQILIDDNRPPSKRPFLFYFNAASVFIICLILLPSIFILKGSAQKKDNPPLSTAWRAEIPFIRTPPRILDTLSFQKSLKKHELITLIKSSITGRFNHDRVKGSEFIISGFISTSSAMSPDDIIITGRLFSDDSLIIDKNTATPENQTFIINKDGTPEKIKGRQKIFPFHLAFSNPAANLSRFSIDIE